MRRWTIRGTGPLAWGLAWAMCMLLPALALGQGVLNYEVPPADPAFPLPLYSTRPENGGLYTFGEYVMFRQTNPLGHQPIAFRGFFDFTGVLTGHPGKFVGNGGVALFADDAGGPGTYQPGFKTGIGWRFDNGATVEFDWMHLMKAQYFAVATLIPPNFHFGPALANSFLSSPVVNFPPEFSGPQIDGPAIGNPPINVNLGFGVWNAADVMSIEFDQRYDQYDIGGRVPIYDTECTRTYGLIGFRFAWIWERFKWRTVDQGFLSSASLDPNVTINTISGQITGGNSVSTTALPDQDPRNVAIYTNIVSNRMYGPTIGCGNEWFMGQSPVGAFACAVDLRAGLLLDVVKERAKYETGLKDASPQIKRSITTYQAVPNLEAQANLYWYPIEGIQVRVGYDIMAFWNTIASPNPVSFNFGGLDPHWASKYRFFDGLNAGIAFIF